MQINDNFIYAGFIFCMGAGVIIFFVWLCHQFHKNQNKEVSHDEFDNKAAVLLKMISESKTHNDLDKVRREGFKIISSINGYVSLQKCALIDEHLRLKEFIIDGEFQQANEVADRIEQHLKLLPSDEITPIS